jgi:hypothetical protein
MATDVPRQRGRQFAAINFAVERARNAAISLDFPTTRQTLIAKVYPMCCYEEHPPDPNSACNLE